MTVADLQKKLYESQKAGDALRVGVLRYLLSAMKNKEIELRAEGKTLSEEDVRKVISKQIKQRNDSIESYKSGGRQDLADKEQSEREILEELLANVQ